MKNEFRIIVNHSRGNQYDYNDKREVFWEPILKDVIRYRSEDLDIEQEYVGNFEKIEARLTSRFGESLKYYLLALVSENTVTLNSQKKVAASKSLVIKTRIINYSSLELGVTIEPVKSLVELFDGNFEYFSTFLEAYMPRAFLDSIYDDYYPEGWEKSTYYLKYKKEIPIQIQNEFNIIDTGNQYLSKNNNVSRIDKARWVWILANTSLIVPTIFAAWYLYTINLRIENREDALDNHSNQIIKHQNELIENFIENNINPKEKNKANKPNK